MMEFVVDGLGGWVRAGEDARQVLLLHGGPGAPWYGMSRLADALPRWTCATFQQRGRPPSRIDGPFDIPTAIADIATVLDHLADRGWHRPFAAGHSWGGHLAWHVAVELGDRMAGVLAIDPLGVIDDMGVGAYEAELRRRVPQGRRDRLAELGALADDGVMDDDQARELGALMWPGLFADPDDTLPFPDVAPHAAIFDQLSASARDHREQLERSLPAVDVPVGAIVGDASPFPNTAGRRVTDLVPRGWTQVADGAGHFVWHERPDAVLAALERVANGVGAND